MAARRVALAHLGTGVVVVALTATAGVATWQVGATAERLKEDASTHLVETMGRHIEAALESTRSMLTGIERNAPSWHGDARDAAAARAAGAAVPTAGIAVLDRAGRQVARAGVRQLPLPPPGHVARMRAAMVAGGLGMSDAYTTAGGRAVAFSVPLRGTSGGALVIITTYESLGLETYVDAFAAGSGGHFYLSDARGVVVGSSDERSRGGGVTADALSGAAREAALSRVEVGGVDSVVVARRLSPAGWSLAFVEPTATFYGGVGEVTRSGIVALLLVLLAAGGAASASAARSHRRVAANESRVRALLRSVDDVVLVVDGGVVRYASPAVARVLGVPEDRAVGAHLDAVLGAAAAAAVADGMSTAAGGTRPVVLGDVRCDAVDGRARWFEATIADCGGDAAVGGAVVALHDVTERREKADRDWFAATHDSLTGLANRASLVDAAATAAEVATRTGQPFALIYLDLDGFKPVNDRWGHQAGDDVLRDVAAHIVTCLRPGDVAARIGGDEFAVLLERFTSADDVVAAASRVREAIAGSYRAGAEQVRLSASIGVTLSYGGREESVESVLRDADLAMYEAKEAGGNRVRLSAVARRLAARPVPRPRGTDEAPAPATPSGEA